LRNHIWRIRGRKQRLRFACFHVPTGRARYPLVHPISRDHHGPEAGCRCNPDRRRGCHTADCAGLMRDEDLGIALAGFSGTSSGNQAEKHCRGADVALPNPV
jgi:hypothetical protein